MWGEYNENYFGFPPTAPTLSEEPDHTLDSSIHDPSIV